MLFKINSEKKRINGKDKVKCNINLKVLNNLLASEILEP
jgi:hypothetical protein